MTDETTQAQPDGASPAASVTPEVESVAPDTTPDVAGETDEGETTPEKPRGGFQRRIAELVGERNDARKAIEEQNRRIDYLVGLISQQRPAPPSAPEPAAPAKAPTLEEHGFDEGKYQQAVIEYAKAEARREAQEALRQDRAQVQAQTRQQSFAEREAKFAEANADYRDTVYNPMTPISQAMAELAMESEQGPELLHHFGKNPDLARALYNLPPVQLAREIGRIEAKLAAEKVAPPAPPAPSLPKAPAPPPRVDAVEPEVEKDPLKMSDAEFDKWRKRQIARR